MTREKTYVGRIGMREIEMYDVELEYLNDISNDWLFATASLSSIIAYRDIRVYAIYLPFYADNIVEVED